MRQPNSIVLAGAQYLGLATQFLTGPLLARALGPEDRGVLAVALVIVSMAPIILGFGVPATYRASAAKGFSNKRVRRTLAWATGLAVILSVPLGLGVAGWLALSGTAYWSVAVMIVASGLTVWRTGILSSCMVTADTWVIARNHILSGSFTLLGIGILFAVGHLNLVYAAAVYAAVSVITTLALLRRGRWSTTASGHSPRSYGLRALPGQVGEVGLVRIDQVVVVFFLGNAWAGQYSVAYSYAYMMLPLMYAIATRVVSGKSMETAKIRTNMKWLLIQTCVGIILAILMAALAKPVIIILFGDPFIEAVPLARMLCVSTAIMGVAYLLMQLNHSGARAAINSACSLAGFVVILLLAPFLVVTGGAMGIALSTIVGVLVCCFLLLLSGYKDFKSPPSSRIGV